MCGAQLRWFPPELSPANAGLLCVLRSCHPSARSCKGRTLGVRWPNRQVTEGADGLSETTFSYHLDGDGSDGDDCRGGMRLSHFRANSVAISLILTPAAVAVLSAALWAARAASRLRTLSNASIGVLGLTMRSFLRL